MIIIIDNCRCPKNDPDNFNLNNLVRYFTHNKYKHSVIKTHSQFDKCIQNNNIKGLILSGSPYFINQNSFKNLSINLYAMSHLKNKVPILGICYGSQLINILNGGTIFHMKKKIKGNFDVDIIRNITILNRNLKKNQKINCGFNFYDQIKTIPNNFKIISTFNHNKKKYICGFAKEDEKIYCLLFHPEAHEKTHNILDNFLKICK